MTTPYRSPFHPFLPTKKSKWIFMGTVVATFSALAYQRGMFGSSENKPEGSRRQNQIYMPVRYEQEFEPLTILKPPLLANFTIRHDPKCNVLTGALYRIVTDETDKRCSVVDVEADEAGVRDLLSRYQVNAIPTIVALRGGIPVSKYTMKNDNVDWLHLKEWIESVADDENSD